MRRIVPDEPWRGIPPIVLLCAVLLTSYPPVCMHAGEAIHSDHVQVSWLAPHAFGSSAMTIGIRFVLQPGWHIYWKNPGDSGAAPQFAFSATGGRVGELQWPYPARLPFMHLTNLGYTDEVIFPLPIEPQPGTALRVEATLEWLVCQEICIPEFGTLTLQRPITSDGPRWEANEQALLTQARHRVPGTAKAAPWHIAAVHRRTGAVHVTLVPTTATQDIPTLFPVHGDIVSPGAPLTEHTSQGVTMTFLLLSGRPPPEHLRFVMVAGDRAWESEDVLVRPAAQALHDVLPMHLSLWGVLGAALVGGLVLNLMPCVFPVLAIKLLALVQADQTPTRRLRAGLGYTLGVLTTFGVLGGVFLPCAPLARRSGGVFSCSRQ